MCQCTLHDANKKYVDSPTAPVRRHTERKTEEQKVKKRIISNFFYPKIPSLVLYFHFSQYRPVYYSISPPELLKYTQSSVKSPPPHQLFPTILGATSVWAEVGVACQKNSWLG